MKTVKTYENGAGLLIMYYAESTVLPNTRRSFPTERGRDEYAKYLESVALSAYH